MPHDLSRGEIFQKIDDYASNPIDFPIEISRGKRINGVWCPSVYNTVQRYQKLTASDLYKVINYQFHRWQRSTTMQRLYKNDMKPTFFKAIEPHQDGVPHMHVLYFVPENEIYNLRKEFNRFFPAPHDHIQLTKYNTKESKKPRSSQLIKDSMGKGKDFFETFGFQTVIYNPVGYILKYVYKSFINLKKQKSINHLQAWYILNKIPRVTTSRTLLSQDDYHRISPLEDNWKYLTR